MPSNHSDLLCYSKLQLSLHVPVYGSCSALCLCLCMSAGMSLHTVFGARANNGLLCILPNAPTVLKPCYVYKLHIFSEAFFTSLNCKLNCHPLLVLKSSSFLLSYSMCWWFVCRHALCNAISYAMSSCLIWFLSVHGCHSGMHYRPLKEVQKFVHISHDMLV